MFDMNKWVTSMFVTQFGMLVKDMKPSVRSRHQHHILAYDTVGDQFECHQHAENVINFAITDKLEVNYIS